MAQDIETQRLNADKVDKCFVRQVITQAKKMKGRDWVSLVLLGLSFVPGKMWKRANRGLYVVSEYENLARDNGYWFFRYLRMEHPSLTVYYPIKDDCSDQRKIIALGNDVRFGSFKHYLLFWAASKQFTSSKNAGFPSRICEDLVLWNFHRFDYILLNHGFTRGKSTVVDASKTNFDSICTCSSLDRRVIIDDNGQPEDKVVVTGFPRHDNLNDSQKRGNLIVLMPTWRKQYDIKYETEKKKVDTAISLFKRSRYYSSYQSLLNNMRLIDFLESNDIELVFYLHDYAQPFVNYFTSSSSRIIVAKSEEYDIQELLKMGSLLITDYSSVCYDFAYMHKPVLYYQFDLEEFEFYQYASGSSFSYEENGMGDICYTEHDLIDCVIELHKKNFKMPLKYYNRVDGFFDYHDTKNCQRVYEQFFS